jgi:hypothetical protein
LGLTANSPFRPNVPVVVVLFAGGARHNVRMRGGWLLIGVPID